jgi:CheY-like chemotaxis protein
MQGTTSSVAKTTETILVVDDDVLIRMVIAAYLRDCGFRVIEAASGQEAIVVLKQDDVAVDVVFSDVEMPEMDGFQLMHWVRDHRPLLAVILAGTPTRAIDAAENLCKSGPDLAKPYEPQLVLERIRRLLAERDRNRRPEPSATSFIPSIRDSGLPPASI